MVSHLKQQFILDALKRYKLIRYALKKVLGVNMSLFLFLGKCFFYIYGEETILRPRPRVSFTMKPAKSDTNKHFEAIRFIEQQMDPSHLFTETTMINIGTLVVIIQAGFREKPDLGF